MDVQGNPFKHYESSYVNKGFEKVLMDKFDTDPIGYKILLKYFQEVMLQADNFFLNADGSMLIKEWWNLFIHYWIFLAFIKALARNGQKVILLSFNYDLCIEQLLFFKGFNYGSITSSMYNIYKCLPNFGYDFTLLKLHGSFNFAICDKCNKIWCHNDYLWDKGDRWECRLCDNGGYNNLYIPPLLRKDLSLVKDAWDDASYFLSKADEVIVMGYSLPFYDINAKELFHNINKDANFYIIDKYAHKIYPNYSFVTCQNRFHYPCPFNWFTTNLIGTSWNEHNFFSF